MSKLQDETRESFSYLSRGNFEMIAAGAGVLAVLALFLSPENFLWFLGASAGSFLLSKFF